MGITVLGLDKVKETLIRLERAIEPDNSKMSEIAKVLLESVQTNFAQEGRPTPWKRLAPATLYGELVRKNVKKKTGIRASKIFSNRKILYRTGKLYRSLKPRAGKDTAAVTTDLYYGWVHNYGTTGGRIPARPFMLIQDEDAPAVEAVLLKPIDEALR
jgi:phage virion morphogenesis protein